MTLRRWIDDDRCSTKIADASRWRSIFKLFQVFLRDVFGACAFRALGFMSVGHGHDCCPLAAACPAL